MGVFLLAGAAGLPADAAAPEAPVPLPSYTLTMTGYNAVPAQTDDTPFETASGAYTNPEVVAARSQDLGKELPFGTIIQIEGPASDNNGGCNYDTVGQDIGYRVIADTMNARLHNRIDVLFSIHDRYILPGGGTMNAASLLGACPGTVVKVVGFVDIKNPANLPKTQADLAALVHGTANLAVK
ncbi:MAG: hypothetical protein KGI78_02065 [Patescibacteria group bacterium]|nr:hypothetical protein [Patescibacteria group bacterium]MDE1944423.1 hypothetical protein [Patescibacteria group bacterium]MDE1945108.1 hypothetical protein [Patescibacteria group bacterium]MDE2057618.1 hypothetical protein [Patescibacteria group bacterium]